jgi:hypothetical protein
VPIPFRLVKKVSAFGLLAFAALASSSLAAETPVKITLDARNASGESGVAILTAQGSKTLVELQMNGGPSDPQPAHFHTGDCQKYGPRPLYQLHPVVKGSSVTTLDVPIDKLTAGDLVINVHKSFDDIATVASCAITKAQ